MKNYGIFFIMLLTAHLGGVAFADQESIDELVTGNRTFACALHKLIASGDENSFYSPYSISTALAMTYAGARDETEVQMADALYFPFGSAVISPIFGELQRLVGEAHSAKVELSIANSIWPADRYEFEPDYLELVKKYYQSEVNLVNYDDADAVRLRINGWVEQATRDKIRNLIPPGALNAMTRMVLVNAVYFKGAWASAFNPEATTPLPFYPAKGEAVDVPTMHQQLQTGYGETSDAQVLELPYEGDRVSMIVVLPRGKNRLADLEKRLSAKHLAGWEQSIAPRKVSVYLPRFTMTAEFNLNAAMRKLGMTDAFDGSRADFSGMDGLINNLFISEIIHKAFVEVNEEGTEAAAATAIIMRTTAMIEEPPVPEFRADRPFLFFIKDRVTGSILFIGRYVKPDAQG